MDKTWTSFSTSIATPILIKPTTTLICVTATASCFYPCHAMPTKKSQIIFHKSKLNHVTPSLIRMTPPNGRKRRGTKEPLDESERGQWKSWLKTQHSKTYDHASGPITSWQIDGEKIETMTDFIFLSSKINVDGDCSHEIKRPLLFGRKAMTNLDSVLKSRDITLLTNFHLVETTVSPRVMYGCEIWTIKNVEHQRIDAFELQCWRRLLGVPWTARKSNQSILKEIKPEYLLEGLVLTLKFQCFGHLMQRTDSLEKTLMLGKIESRRKRGRQRMRCLDGITDSMDLSLSKQDGEGQGSLVCCSSWSCRVRHNWATEQKQLLRSNNSNGFPL